MILIIPPYWLINVVYNSEAKSPTISSFEFKTEQEKDLAECSVSDKSVECRIKLALNEIDEYSLFPIIYQLAECESNFSETICGDNSKSCGFLQFKLATFQQWNCKGSRFNLEDSVKCGVKLINAGVGHKESGWMNCWRMKQIVVLAPKMP